jgi:hypothetical protein
LAQDVVQARRGAVLAVDEAGDLWAYTGGAGGRLGAPTRLGSGFAGEALYPADGWLLPQPRPALSTQLVWGVTATGDLYRHQIGYKDFGDLSDLKVGNGWLGYRVVSVGDLDGDRQSDILAVKEATGDLFLYRGASGGLRFTWPYPKVGNGWKDFRLLAPGDLNGDGKNDILGIDPKGDLFLYAGLGDGRFATKAKVGNGWTGFDLAAGADLDGDGRGDIVGRNDSGHLFFYRGLGDGRFAAKTQIGNGWGPSGTSPDPDNTGVGQMARLSWWAPSPKMAEPM